MPGLLSGLVVAHQGSFISIPTHQGTWHVGKLFSQRARRRRGPCRGCSRPSTPRTSLQIQGQAPPYWLCRPLVQERLAWGTHLEGPCARYSFSCVGSPPSPARSRGGHSLPLSCLLVMSVMLSSSHTPIIDFNQPVSVSLPASFPHFKAIVRNTKYLVLCKCQGSASPYYHGAQTQFTDGMLRRKPAFNSHRRVFFAYNLDQEMDPFCRNAYVYMYSTVRAGRHRVIYCCTSTESDNWLRRPTWAIRVRMVWVPASRNYFEDHCFSLLGLESRPQPHSTSF